MSKEQTILDMCRFTTIYEAITSILKDQLTIDEMKRMVSALSRYVDEEEQSMSRLK